MLQTFVAISFLFLFQRVLAQSDTTLVTTNYGPVQGFTAVNGSVNVFFGIPFAAPPINELRFEKPIAPTAWTDTLIANTTPPFCVQHTAASCWSGNCKEDCLYLNIYAPHQTNPNGIGYPVAVFIHGGAFETGAAVAYNNYTDIGSRYVAQGIVVVAIQYRLSVIGFASTGDDGMPAKFSNYGLWDQQAALQFVVDNIGQFGGDPTNITVWGLSAGAASASLLTLSPYSQDLFHRSFQMSSSSLAAWACNGRVVNASLDLASALNCTSSSISTDIKECMKNRTVAEIQTAMSVVGTTRSATDVDFVKWGPRVDGDFLPNDLPELMQISPPKPTVTGFADLESLLLTLLIGNDSIYNYAIPVSDRPVYNASSFATFVQEVVAREDMLGATQAAMVQQKICDFYLDPSRSNGTIQQFNTTADFYLQRHTMLLSDLQFIVPVIWEAQQKANASWPVYLYMSTYYHEGIFSSSVTVRQNFHSNDLNYLFYRGAFVFNENDTMMNTFFTNCLINFIKMGIQMATVSSRFGTKLDNQMAPYCPT